MSTYKAISDVSATLSRLLWNDIDNDTHWREFYSSILNTEAQISLNSPNEFENQNRDKKLSLFLYHIEEFSSMRNHEMPVQGNDGLKYSSLHLALHYLVTPYTGNITSDHVLLGKIMQIFSHNAILRGSILEGTLGNNRAELRLVMDPFSIDELNKLWSTFGATYKLSLSYSVVPVLIESAREKEVQRVIEQRANHMQNVRRDDESQMSRNIEAIFTKLSLAIRLIDDYTNTQPLGTINISLFNEPHKPIKNSSGYCLFLNLPKDTYTVQVTSDYYFNETSSVQLSSLNPKSPVKEIVLKPNPSYPFPNGSTLIRGIALDPNNNPAPKAVVEIKEKRIRNLSSEKGEFVLYFPTIKKDDVINENGRRFIKIGNGTKTFLTATFGSYYGEATLDYLEEGTCNNVKYIYLR